MSPPVNIEQVLRRASIFSTFTDTGIKILAAVQETRVFHPGQFVFRQGDESTSMHLLTEGRFQISQNQQGKNLILDVIEISADKAMAIGQVALLRGGKRLCSVQCLAQGLAFEFSRQRVLELQNSKPQACIKLFSSTIEDIGHVVEGELQTLAQELSSGISL